MHTRELAGFIARSRLPDIPETVQDEAARAIVNWLGCAVGGAMEPAVDAALDALFAFSGAKQATLIGRGDRTDILLATLLAGVGSSALEFDDVHAPTGIAASAPVAAALFAAAEHRASHGSDLLHAYILGVEVACRAGIALGAAHRDRGWDITCTCGVLGAAAAAAKLLGLTPERIQAALGIAATQAAGIGEIAETPSRPLATGFAARNGLFAALLVQRDFTSAAEALEGRRGFLSVLGASADPDRLVAGWGSTWQVAALTYKPFACSRLLTPAIDACLQLRREHDLRAADVAAVNLRVHPLAAQVTARNPMNALDCRRSIRHGAAAALARGAAGVRQFADESVHDSRIARMRSRIEVMADEGLGCEQAHAEIVLRDGRCVTQQVRCALGSPERPLTDADLAEKFRALATEVLATDQAERLLALAWNLRALIDVGALIRASVPEEEPQETDLPGSPLIPR